MIRGARINGNGSVLDAVPPHDAEAERRVLVGLLFRPEWRDKLAAIIGPEHFHIEAHSLIYARALGLEKLDETTLIDDLKHAGLIERVGGHAGLAKIFCETNDTIHPDASAEIVRRLAKLREIRHIGERLLSQGVDDRTDPDDAVREALDMLGTRPERGGDVTISAADITTKPLEWLWPSRFPQGKLSLIVGPPDVGKSIFTYGMTATITNGWTWPDHSGVAQKGGVILLDCEDDPEDTVVPRLITAGADLGMVRLVRSSRLEEGGHFFDLTRDLPLLEKAVQETPAAKAIVISPLGAFMGGTKQNDGGEVRVALAPLAALAARCRIAVIAIMHLNKTAGQKAIDRISGSSAFVAAARAVWLIARDEQDRERRVVAKVKSNLAKDPGGLAYRIVDRDGQPQIEWEAGVVNDSADDLLGDGKGSGQVKAKAWIAKTFESDEFIATNDLRTMAEEEGLNWWTVKSLLNSRTCSVASEKEKGRRGRWGYRKQENKKTPVTPFVEFVQFAQLPSSGEDSF
jgi:hypothetical protein